jgi:hypothetical protein
MASLLLLLLLSPLSTTAASSGAYPTIPGSIDTSFPASQDSKLIPIRREVYGDGRIFDITHRYTSDMPSMGSENGLGQFLRLPESMKNGSFANISEMKLITHTGTHVDAPGHYYDHYFDAGFDVDTLDLEVLNGNENILILTYIVVVFCWLNPVFFSLLLMGLWKGIRFVYGRWCVYMRT